MSASALEMIAVDRLGWRLWRAYQEATGATTHIAWLDLKPEVRAEFQGYARAILARTHRAE